MVEARITKANRRILIRDVEPVTPCGLATKTIVGDVVGVRATLVADGHDVLSATLRWRRRDGHASRSVGASSANASSAGAWTESSMSVDDHGFASGTLSFDEPGSYEFQITAFTDHFATWRRDLRLRHDAGEDLSIEFAEGAAILDRLARRVPSERRELLRSSVATLRSETCSAAVRLRVALDESLAEVALGRPRTGTTTRSATFSIRADRELAVFGAWYEMFARSEGGFVKGSRIWRRLETIAEASFDVLYLPPIHPVGITHRKGRNNTLVAGPNDVGSPWAIGSAEGGHDTLDPALGDLADFRAFVGRARELGMEVALDYALQCSPDHPWVAEHPEWFTQRVDGSIRYAENPPKKYQDIYPINFWPDDNSDRAALWNACLDILWTWIELGIKVFRVDNPHTKPLAFWEWIISEVQSVHPDVVFLSEAFTDPAMMHSLAEIGFSQSYTYFTWRHDKTGLTEYGEELAHGQASGWFRPNLWPTTPDILTGQLRNGSKSAFELRALLAATMGPSWGMYSGYELCEGDPHPEKEEYAFSEKYELKNRDFESPKSIWGFISALNRIRRANPALSRMDTLNFHHVDHDDVIAYSHVRRVGPGASPWNRVLVIANLSPDETAEATVYLDRDALKLSDGGPVSVSDLLTGESWNWSGYGDYVRLGPADRVGHIFSVDYGPR